MIKTIIALGAIAYVGPKVYRKVLPGLFILINAPFFGQK